METIKSLLDAAKEAEGVETEYALAKTLGLTKQQVSDYYKGRVVASEFACLQIAKALKRDYEEIQTIVRIEAEKDETRRQVWKDNLKKLGGYAAGIMLMFFLTVTLIVTPTPAEASNGKVSTAQHFVLCKVLVRWIKAADVAVRRVLSTVAPRFGFAG